MNDKCVCHQLSVSLSVIRLNIGLIVSYSLAPLTEQLKNIALQLTSTQAAI